MREPVDQRSASPMPTPSIATIWSAPNGTPLTDALFQLPGRRISNAPQVDGDRLARLDPADRRHAGMRGLFYVDGRYNEQLQHRFRPRHREGPEGLHGRQRPRRHPRARRDAGRSSCGRQNLFNKDYQAGRVQLAVPGQLARSAARCRLLRRSSTRVPRRQLYGAFLAEPRTFGVTAARQARFARPAPAAAAVTPPPPAPPPPPVGRSQPAAAVRRRRRHRRRRHRGERG